MHLELFGNSLHVGNSEDSLIVNPQTRLWDLPRGEQIRNLVRLAPQDAGDLAQQEIFCLFHESIYAADSFFRDEK